MDERAILRNVSSETSSESSSVRPPEVAFSDLRSRSIAVTSGKGGVGKTSTAVNLALHFAVEGRRTALLDLDPLADVTAFLDMTSAETALDASTLSGEADLASYTVSAFDTLDILFPGLKLQVDGAEREGDRIGNHGGNGTAKPTAPSGTGVSGASALVRRLISDRYCDELLERYDILVMDLPAGSEEETNLAFADMAGHILLVTNPEPTAHMSAGGWLRALFESRGPRTVHVWHNRFSRGGPDGFNPRDVIRNYNNNSPEEARINEEQASYVSDLAFVPEDPALNMLRAGVPDPLVISLRSMRSLCAQIADERSQTLLAEQGMSEVLSGFISEVLSRDHARGEASDELVSEVELLAVDALGARMGARVSNLSSFMRRDPSLSLLGPEKRKRVARAIEKVRGDDLWQDAHRARARLSSAIEKRIGQTRAFASVATDSVEQALLLADDSVRSLLVTVGSSSIGGIRRNAQVLLFYLAFFKLLRHQKVIARIKRAMPRRTVGGRVYRDRHRQIRYLVAGDETYRKQYVGLVRSLFPVLTRQISALSRTLGSGRLLIRRDGKVERRAYLTLFSNALHDCLFSGLGIITGFKYREASRAFSEAAAELGRRVLDTE